jgi:hypothetical protein
MAAMIKALLFFILASISVQAGSIVQPPGDSMPPLERSKLQMEKKINNRIKIYKAVSGSWLKTLVSAVDANDFEAVPSVLQAWMSLLTESLKDIDANVERKKKSGALIEYEIQLRKSIHEVKDHRVEIPLEQLDSIDAWVDQAEKIQSKFLDILFLGK